MPDTSPTPPLLGHRWTNPLPVVVVGTLSWLVVAIIATVGALPWGNDLKAIAWSGVVVGIFGGAIFAWQLSAARRGRRGAQQGLVPTRPDQDSPPAGSVDAGDR